MGVGGGPSTFEAAKVSISQAKDCGHNLKESVFAANAFFPFTDAPQLLADAGVKVGLVPAGGRKEERVRAFFQEKGISMVYLPEKYRGFCLH